MLDRLWFQLLVAAERLRREERGDSLVNWVVLAVGLAAAAAAVVALLRPSINGRSEDRRDHLRRVGDAHARPPARGERGHALIEGLLAFGLVLFTVAFAVQALAYAHARIVAHRRRTRRGPSRRRGRDTSRHDRANEVLAAAGGDRRGVRATASRAAPTRSPPRQGPGAAPLRAPLSSRRSRRREPAGRALSAAEAAPVIRLAQLRREEGEGLVAALLLLAGVLLPLMLFVVAVRADRAGPPRRGSGRARRRARGGRVAVARAGAQSGRQTRRARSDADRRPAPAAARRNLRARERLRATASAQVALASIPFFGDSERSRCTATRPRRSTATAASSGTAA